MALITSIATGNWENGPTWDSNPATPGIGDDVVIANTHTVTMTANFTLGASHEITVDAGGTLNVNNGVTLTLGDESILNIDGTSTISGELSDDATTSYIGVSNAASLTLANGSTWSVTCATTNISIDAGGDLYFEDDSIAIASELAGAGDIHIDGSVDFTGSDPSDMITNDGTITFEFGAHANTTVTYGLVTMPKIVVNNNGITTFAAQDRLTVGHDDGFTLTAGKYDDGGFDHIIRGDILINGGTLTSTGTWRVDDPGDVVNATAANAFADLAVMSTATLTGTTHAAKVSGGGAIDVDGNILCLYHPAANFWTFNGTVADTAGGGSIDVALSASVANAVRIEAPAADFNVTGDDFTLTATNGIDVGAVNCAAVSAGKYAKLALVSSSSMGAVVLGDVGAVNKSGHLACGGGSVTMTSLADGNAANYNNQLQLESCYLQVSGTFDCCNIGLSATSAGVVHIEGLDTATIQNTDETSTANGAPTFPGGGPGTSTVDTGDAIFHSWHVGNTLAFTGGGDYVIDSVTDPDTVEVVGDASGEPNGRAVTVSNCNGNVVHGHNATKGAKTNGVLTDITYDTEAPPNTRQLMGMGY